MTNTVCYDMLGCVESKDAMRFAWSKANGDYLLHARSGGSGARVELADVGVGEPVLAHQRHRDLKVLISFPWEAADDICGQLQSRHQAQQRVSHPARHISRICCRTCKRIRDPPT